MPVLFLLSPAKVTGQRALMVRRPDATFTLACRLREQGAPLGEVFSFMSGLYFRGKYTYARTFASPPSTLSGAYVITSGMGLVSPEKIITLGDLEALAATAIASDNAQYVEALQRDARQLAEKVGADCQIVLLGSVATTKYLTPLLEIFGERLLFPVDFIGRGDLSRGGLLLRAAASGIELPYAPIGNSTRHGPRPPRLLKR